MANWVSAEWLAGVLDEHSAALELFAAQWSETPEDCVQGSDHRTGASARKTSKRRSVAVSRRSMPSDQFQSIDHPARRHEALAARLVRMESDPMSGSAFDVQELSAGLTQLDDELREVVVARIWGGLGFAEIGGMLNLSTSTAFRRFEAGLSALRGILEGPCEMTTNGPKTGPTKKSK